MCAWLSTKILSWSQDNISFISSASRCKKHIQKAIDDIKKEQPDAVSK